MTLDCSSSFHKRKAYMRGCMPSSAQKMQRDAYLVGVHAIQLHGEQLLCLPRDRCCAEPLCRNHCSHSVHLRKQHSTPEPVPLFVAFEHDKVVCMQHWPPCHARCLMRVDSMLSVQGRALQTIAASKVPPKAWLGAPRSQSRPPGRLPRQHSLQAASRTAATPA